MCFFGEHFLQCECVSHCLRWGVLLVFPYEIYRLSCDIADIFGPIMYFFFFFFKGALCNISSFTVLVARVLYS